MAAEAAVPLAAANLDVIRTRGIATPSYPRDALVPRILHIGVGGFHRAHLARYTDECAAQGSDWGICGVGLLEHDERLADTLRSQDHLYTLIERDSTATAVSVVGSIVDYVFVAGEEDRFVERVADPKVAILSLTITEGGYRVDQPNHTIESITRALDRRLEVGAPRLTVLSCDNLPGNGDAARAAIATVAERNKYAISGALDSYCTFPNSMVDRITPQTTEADRDWLRDRGVDDGWPVVCESFRQWVIEDDFAAGRPEWQTVGVLFSDRVHDWELYKLRMLNASHSCMAYLCALANIVYVDEAIGAPEVSGYLERLLSTEVIPTLRPIPGHPPADYAESVFRRFANTGVRDQIARLCIDGTAKFPTFLLPTVDAQLEGGGPIGCAALALAAWARYLAIVPDGERATDSHGDEAAALARRALSEPAVFLDLGIFSERIRASDRFRAAFSSASRALTEDGPLAAAVRASG